MLTAEVPERVVLLELDREVAAAFLVGQQGVHRAVKPIGLQRHRLPQHVTLLSLKRSGCKQAGCMRR